VIDAPKPVRAGEEIDLAVLATYLDAGTYQYTVSGGKCSFTLTVAAAGP